MSIFGRKRRFAVRPRVPLVESLEARYALAAPWLGYGHDSQHTGLSAAASQSLSQIAWQTPVDEAPQFSGDELLIHYGSPLVTAANTVIVPVKTTATGNFEVRGIDGGTG